MASARTATAATDRSSTGGICQARVISHAETPASARALPSDSTPRAMAASRRGKRGRNSMAIAVINWRRPAIAAGSDRRIAHPTFGAHLHHPGADGDNGVAVADDDHRRAGAGTLDNRPQHPLLGTGVQVSGRLVEQ